METASGNDTGKTAKGQAPCAVKRKQIVLYLVKVEARELTQKAAITLKLLY
jgi:hypothetical protein